MAEIENMTFSCYARVENISPEIAKKLAYAGFTKVKMGIETSNSEMKRALNKEFTSKCAKNAVDTLRNEGIFSHTSFQIGFPEDTTADIDETIKLAKYLNPDYAYFFLFVPYPDTPLYKTLKDKVKTTDPQELWLFNPTLYYNNFSKIEILRELGRTWYEFYKERVSLTEPVINTPNDVVVYVNDLQKKIYSSRDKVKF